MNREKFNADMKEWFDVYQQVLMYEAILAVTKQDEQTIEEYKEQKARMLMIIFSMIIDQTVKENDDKYNAEKAQALFKEVRDTYTTEDVYITDNDFNYIYDSFVKLNDEIEEEVGRLQELEAASECSGNCECCSGGCHYEEEECCDNCGEECNCKEE